MKKSSGHYPETALNLLSGLPLKWKQATTPLVDDEIFSIKNLQVKFKTTNGILHAVRGVDLKAKRGEIIGIVGESGSGKSVTVKSLIGFNDHAQTTADQMNFLDQDLRGANERVWELLRGNQVGYIPQDPLTSLNPVHKIGKQLTEAYLLAQKRSYQRKRKLLRQELLAAKFKTSPLYKELVTKNKQAVKQLKQEYVANTKKPVVLEKIRHILEFIGINDPAAMNAYPHQFSGGMRQRIVIAMVLLAEPKLIIADEPTTALDVIVQAKVLELLKQINEKYQMTIIMISHNIGMIANFCDYIYVMYAGDIVEKGTVHDLFTRPLHPYTWALITAIPDSSSNEKLVSIPGTPPNLLVPPVGDAFAPRNQYAMKIDFEQKPPMFQVSPTHFAATWLLHKDNPNPVVIPEAVQTKLKISQQALANKKLRVTRAYDHVDRKNSRDQLGYDEWSDQQLNVYGDQLSQDDNNQDLAPYIPDHFIHYQLMKMNKRSNIDEAYQVGTQQSELPRLLIEQIIAANLNKQTPIYWSRIRTWFANRSAYVNRKLAKAPEAVQVEEVPTQPTIITDAQIVEVEVLPTDHCQPYCDYSIIIDEIIDFNQSAFVCDHHDDQVLVEEFQPAVELPVEEVEVVPVSVDEQPVEVVEEPVQPEVVVVEEPVVEVKEEVLHVEPAVVELPVVLEEAPVIEEELVEVALEAPVIFEPVSERTPVITQVEGSTEEVIITTEKAIHTLGVPQLVKNLSRPYKKKKRGKVKLEKVTQVFHIQKPTVVTITQEQLENNVVADNSVVTNVESDPEVQHEDVGAINQSSVHHLEDQLANDYEGLNQSVYHVEAVDHPVAPTEVWVNEPVVDVAVQPLISELIEHNQSPVVCHHDEVVDQPTLEEGELAPLRVVETLSENQPQPEVEADFQEVIAAVIEDNELPTLCDHEDPVAEIDPPTLPVVDFEETSSEVQPEEAVAAPSTENDQFNPFLDHRSNIEIDFESQLIEGAPIRDTLTKVWTEKAVGRSKTRFWSYPNLRQHHADETALNDDEADVVEPTAVFTPMTDVAVSPLIDQLIDNQAPEVNPVHEVVSEPVVEQQHVEEVVVEEPVVAVEPNNEQPPVELVEEGQTEVVDPNAPLELYLYGEDGHLKQHVDKFDDHLPEVLLFDEQEPQLEQPVVEDQAETEVVINQSPEPLINEVISQHEAVNVCDHEHLEATQEELIPLEHETVVEPVVSKSTQDVQELEEKPSEATDVVQPQFHFHGLFINQNRPSVFMNEEDQSTAAVAVEQEPVDQVDQATAVEAVEDLVTFEPEVAEAVVEQEPTVHVENVEELGNIQVEEVHEPSVQQATPVLDLEPTITQVEQVVVPEPTYHPQPTPVVWPKKKNKRVEKPVIDHALWGWIKLKKVVHVTQKKK